MITLYLEAPFAASRTFTAGWYRPTAGFLNPSTAYGLLLNIAGIESRLREEDHAHDGSAPTSLIRPGLPEADLAIGVPAAASLTERFPRVQSIYQQLHNYPVGGSGKERAESCRGNKYNITPVRREFLSDVKAIITLSAAPEFESRIRSGLRGEFNEGRYGIPFLGENAFLLDRLDEICQPVLVQWLERLTPGDGGTRDHTTRLTIQIDRADLSKTRSDLFAPGTESLSNEPATNAWVRIESIVATPPTQQKQKTLRKPTQ
jgi:CRISPR-associated protein Cas5t